MQTAAMRRAMLDGGLPAVQALAGGSFYLRLLYRGTELSGNGYAAQPVFGFAAAEDFENETAIKRLAARALFGAVGGDLNYDQLELANSNNTTSLMVSSPFTVQRIPQGKTHAIMIAFQNPFSAPSTRISDFAAGGTTFQHTIQAAVFDPAQCYRVGLHFPIGGDSTGRGTNRNVQHIDPVNAEDQSATSSGNNAWSPEATSTSGNLNTSWPEAPPWSQYGIFCRDWPGFIERNVPHLVNWLRPGWISGSPPGSPYPLIHFNDPHGRSLGRASSSFFQLLEAGEEGLDHLVRGYYESIYRLRSQGVFVSTGLGALEIDGENARRPTAAVELIKQKLTDARTLVHLAQATSQLSSSATADLLADFDALGQGASIDGVPSTNGSITPVYWRTSVDYPVNVAYADAKGLIFSPQDSGAVGNYPVVGTGGFTTAYGSRWFIFRVAPNDFGLTFPAAGASTGTKDTYLNVMASAVQGVLGEITNSIVLLDYRIAVVAGQRGLTADNFLP